MIQYIDKKKYLLDKIHFYNKLEINKLLLRNNIIVIIDKDIVKYFTAYFNKHKIKYILASHKNIATFENIIKELVNFKADKNTILVGIGGGEITDLTGFIASIYMRGVICEYIPTTLLAIVDAAIGGKNAINYYNIKNIIGTIYQPNNIYINIDYLNTLSIDEINNGYAEIIKISLLRSKKLLDFVYDYIKKGEYNSNILENIIKESIELKIQIVSDDEFDNNIRNLLNFGHTIGHILELNYNISHGEAIIIGMYYESLIAKELGLIDRNLLKEIDTYLSILKDNYTKYSLSSYLDYIYLDKKNNNGIINFPFIKSIGEGSLIKIKIEEIIKIINTIK